MIRLKRKENPVAAPTPAAVPPKAAPRPTPSLVLPVAAPAEARESAWQALPLEGAFELAYRDAAGHPSLRRLHAVELKIGPGKLLLGGIDDGLDAYRGFRVDRIHSLRAMDSGEVVSRNILDWLIDRAQKQERARARIQAAKAPAEARAG